MEKDLMETLLALCLGLGLSASCGFRVFVPLLGLSVAAASGHLTLAPDFQWLGSTPALVILASATILEIAAYYIPWLDHFLDTIATPAAVVAGAMVSAAVFTDMSPMLRWSLAAVAGGGLAAAVQTTTVAARGLSSALSLGLGNPLVATVELGGSFLGTVASLVAPLFAMFLLAGLVGFGVYGTTRWHQKHRQNRAHTAKQ